MFPRAKVYKYSSIRVILLKLNNGKDISEGVTYISSGKGFEDRDVSFEQKNSELGTYYFYVEIDWNEKTIEEDRVFNVNNYGFSDIFFEQEMQG